jgi:hypothetical protein
MKYLGEGPVYTMKHATSGIHEVCGVPCGYGVVVFDEKVRKTGSRGSASSEMTRNYPQKQSKKVNEVTLQVAN